MRGAPPGTILTKRWKAVARHREPAPGDLAETAPGGSWYEVIAVKRRKGVERGSIVEEGETFAVRVMKLEPQDQEPDWLIT